MDLIFHKDYGLYYAEDKIYCDSLQIADSFNKRHSHVIRDIRNVLEKLYEIREQDFGGINFILSNYKDSRNRMQEKYLLTKDAFTLVSIGYTGVDAMENKVRNIKNFNEMTIFILK